MSFPVVCADCDDIIDTHTFMFVGVMRRNMTEKTPCPGKGKHTQATPVGEECFGLLKKIRVSRIGGNAFCNYEYMGSKNRAFLFFALMYAKCAGIRVFIGGKIVKFSVGGGFHGEGFDRFQALRQKAA